MFKNRIFQIKVLKDTEVTATSKTPEQLAKELLLIKANAETIKSTVEDVVGTVVVGAVVVIGFKTFCSILDHTTRALLR